MKRILIALAFLISSALGQTTPNLGLNLPPFGTPNWNVPVNANFTKLDTLLACFGTANTAGTITYFNGTIWTCFPGNTSGTQVFQENALGVPSWGAGGGGSGPTIQTNGINNAIQTTLNFITSTTNTAGLTITPSNSTSTEKFEVTGTLAHASLPTLLSADIPNNAANTTGTAANLTGCTPSTAGSICYWNGSAWTLLAGNASGTLFLQETSAGVPSWASAAGSGTVTSVATTSPITGGTITTTGTIACATCVTSAASLTSGQLMTGAGSQGSQVSNLTGDVTTSGSTATTVVKVNGGAVPASANVLGSNGSSQLIAATAHGVSTILACVAASGSGTAYTCTTSPSFTPADGDAIHFEADVANTGAATLNVNASSAAPLKKQGGGTALVANDLLAGQDTLLIYDGTNWQMQGQSGNAPAGGVTSFTGDGTILNNSASTGAVTATLTSAVSDTVLGNPTGSTAAPVYTANPVVASVATNGSNGGITGVEGTGASLTFATGSDFLYAYTTLHCWAETLNSASALNECITAAHGTWTAGDLLSVNSGTTFDISDSGVVATNVVTAASNFTNGQVVQAAGANKTLTTATAHGVSLPRNCVAASASGTAYTCTTTPSFTPADGDEILFEADVANTGSATLAVNGVSAATLKKQGGGTNLVANDLLAGQNTIVIFDGTNWQLETLTGNAAGGVTSLSGDGVVITNSASTGVVTLTIAGTSGGIPYFNATTTWASTALLANNQIMVGGGAGGAPSTTTLKAGSTGITGNGNGNNIVYGAGNGNASANAALGTATLQGPNQTGAGGASSAAGSSAVIGGSNAATNAASQSGGAGVFSGLSTGATTGHQGLLQLGSSFTKGTTVTLWNLQCSQATAEQTQDCPVGPTNILGVAEAVGAVGVQVLTGGDVPVNASAVVTVGDSVCAGATAGKVTDSGGTGSCPFGAIVGYVTHTSGTYNLIDGTTVTASTTLPIIHWTYAGAVSPASGSLNCVNVTPVTVSANVTTDQNLMACTIPANALNIVGKTLRIHAKSVYSTPAASAATLNFKAKLCSVSGCASGNVATLVTITSSANPGSVTNNTAHLNVQSSTQTAGAASRSEASGDLLIDLGALSTAADTIFADTNTATIAGSPSDIDFTAQNFLQISVAFSAASASNSVTERQLVVDTVN